MVEAENRDRVVAALEDRLRLDPSRTQVSRISEFGLVEITRKRSRSNLRRVLTRPCPCCRERGRIKSIATVCLDLRRRLLRHDGDGPLTVRLHPELAEALTTSWAVVLDELEEKLGAAPRLHPDPSMPPDRFEVVPGGQTSSAAS